jgi:hypothetical protein
MQSVTTPRLMPSRCIEYASGNTSNTSGTLTVTDGGAATANIALLGTYVAGQFHITSDGHGGTLVTDPPVAAPTDQNPLTLVNAHH